MVGRGLLGGWAFIAVGALLATGGPRAQPVAAQDTATRAGQIEEIVVTAQRRKERLQDVPLSVASFSQASLDQQDIHTIDDLARISPGVTFTRNGTGTTGNYNDEDSDVSIRGVDLTAGTSTTGIYIDDTPIQGRHLSFSTLSAFPALTDLDRVELLRGPQGTLFGSGSEGGTLRFIRPEPGLQDYSGRLLSEAAFTQGGGPSYQESAAIGGPIVPGELGFRVSGSFRHDGGWVDRVDPHTLGTLDANANWQDTEVASAALKWAPVDGLSITPSFYYQKLHVNDTAAYWPSLSDPNANRFWNGNALKDESTDPFLIASVKVELELDWVRLSSTTSYYSRHQGSVEDNTQFDRAIVGLPPVPQPGDAGRTLSSDTQRNLYEEVKAQSIDDGARLKWTLGIFYAHLDENATEFIVDPTLNGELGGFLCFLVACPGGVLLNQPTLQIMDTQIAGFGQADFNITDTLKVTAGLRVARTDYTGDANYFGAFVGLKQFSSTGSASETPVTPKFAISYQPDRDDLFYVSAAKGYRVGGINANVSVFCAADLTSLGLADVPNAYRSDSLWSYEVGAKNALLDRRIQINTSAFFIDWSDIQQNVYLGGCGQLFTANLGHAQSKGFDIDIQAYATEKLSVGLTAAYTDAEYTQTVFAGPLAAGKNILPVVSKGDRLPGAPWSVHLSAEYSFDDVGDRSPYLRVDYRFTSAQEGLQPGQDPSNGGGDPSLPGLPLTNNLSTRLGLRWNGIDLSAFGDNLTGAHPVLFKAHDTLTSPLYFARSVRPRTAGATATYRF